MNKFKEYTLEELQELELDSIDYQAELPDSIRQGFQQMFTTPCDA